MSSQHLQNVLSLPICLSSWLNRTGFVDFSFTLFPLIFLSFLHRWSLSIFVVSSFYIFNVWALLIWLFCIYIIKTLTMCMMPSNSFVCTQKCSNVQFLMACFSFPQCHRIAARWCPDDHNFSCFSGCVTGALTWDATQQLGAFNFLCFLFFSLLPKIYMFSQMKNL